MTPHSDHMRVLIFGAPWVWFDMQIIPMDQAKDPRSAYYAGSIPGYSGLETILPSEWGSVEEMFRKEHEARYGY